MLVMFVPLFDAAWTIGRRILHKKSPFKRDLEHFHHNLLKLVKSRRNTVLIYAFFVALFGFTALFLKTEGKVVLFVILGVFMTWLELKLQAQKN
jgi:UDP-GlcNAc:undecaprenyl-phosphate GlcNAc-1-phosphate transferase